MEKMKVDKKAKSEKFGIACFFPSSIEKDSRFSDQWIIEGHHRSLKEAEKEAVRRKSTWKDKDEVKFKVVEIYI